MVHQSYIIQNAQESESIILTYARYDADDLLLLRLPVQFWRWHLGHGTFFHLVYTTMGKGKSHKRVQAVMNAFKNRHYTCINKYPPLPLRMTTMGRTFDFIDILFLFKSFNALRSPIAHIAGWAWLPGRLYFLRDTSGAKRGKITWFLRFGSEMEVGWVCQRQRPPYTFGGLTFLHSL